MGASVRRGAALVILSKNPRGNFDALYFYFLTSSDMETVSLLYLTAQTILALVFVGVVGVSL
jgi:hypothetical protein